MPALMLDVQVPMYVFASETARDKVYCALHGDHPAVVTMGLSFSMN
jgi:hypothetical protein